MQRKISVTKKPFDDTLVIELDPDTAKELAVALPTYVPGATTELRHEIERELETSFGIPGTVELF